MDILDRIMDTSVEERPSDEAAQYYDTQIVKPLNKVTVPQ